MKTRYISDSCGLFVFFGSHCLQSAKSVVNGRWVGGIHGDYCHCPVPTADFTGIPACPRKDPFPAITQAKKQSNKLNY